MYVVGVNMIKNINDIYREKISSKSNYKEIFDYLFNLNNNEFNYVIDIMLSDLYKLAIYTYPIDNNEGIMNFFEKHDIRYIKNKSLTIEDLLKDAMDATMYFNDMTLINKTILFEEINEQSKEDFLNKINKFSVLDKIVYLFRYDLDLFKEIYIDYINKEKSDGKIVRDFLHYRMLDLQIINDVKFNKFCLEFLRTYYKNKLYLNQKNQYMSFIESNSIANILKKIVIDSKFMDEILKNYLDYQLIIEEEKQKIDEYFNQNKNEQIQKKLKFNNKKDL